MFPKVTITIIGPFVEGMRHLLGGLIQPHGIPRWDEYAYIHPHFLKLTAPPGQMLVTAPHSSLLATLARE
jgi:hypothetical protein